MFMQFLRQWIKSMLRIEWRLRGGFRGGREVIRIGRGGKEEESKGGGEVIWLRRA
jgi:hypothetical protein